MADLTLRGQYEESVREVAQGQVVWALERCHRILSVYPRHIGTYGILGQIYLELGEHEEAANLFRRVLSADPEDPIAYASLGAIYEERGLLDEAIWQLERALELSPGNRQVRRELTQLLAERGDPGPLTLTRAGLARIYLRGQLYTKAIGELRELLDTEPHRLDLRVALAEALWRDRRREEAAVVCRGVLHELPDCLKANLILGYLWLHTDEDEHARRLLQRAQAMDPNNAMAQALFGSESPLPPRVARIPLQEPEPDDVDELYVLDDEDIVSVGRIIDGSPAAPRESHVIAWDQLDEEAFGLLGLVNEPEPSAPSSRPPRSTSPVSSVPEAEPPAERLSPEPPPREREKEPHPPVVVPPPVAPGELAEVEEAQPEKPEATEDEAPPSASVEERPVSSQDAAPAEPPSEEAPAQDRNSAAPTGGSLFQAERQYVEQHPEDHSARLRLARRYRDVGATDEALEQYGQLLEEGAAPRAIVHDLELLNRLSPGQRSLWPLLADARDRLGPPSADHE